MSENKIKVSASTTSKAVRVNVSTPTLQGTVALSQDTSAYNANIAEQWAISENIVLGKDYSSKYYANKAKESASNAQGFESAIRDVYNGFLGETTEAIENVQGARDEAIANIETSKVEAIDSINSTKTTILSDIEFVADGEKEEIKDLADLIKENAEEIANRTSFAMFDTVLKDHVLTYEETKGLALQGTYVYKSAIAGSRYGYPDFYNKVIEEYNEATATETVNGVTVKVHSNGHKFYDIANKSAIDSSFNSLGTAWFYGVDTAEERIFLPRDNYFAVKGNVPVAGNGMALGLTDGTNLKGLAYYQVEHLCPSANGYGASIGSTSGSAVGFNISTTVGVTADPTKSGIVAHLETNEDKYLYICVGNTVADTSWVDVVTQVQGGVKDLEDKKNTSIAEIDANAKSYDNLTKRQITNCLLEVPQNIKLELNDGTLTLKAGSKVIVPNGAGVFDEVIIESDISQTVTSEWAMGKHIICYNKTHNTFLCRINHASGTSPSGNYTIYYNTSANVVRDTSITDCEISLPIGFATVENFAFTSIDQVFNGFGYIGSTIWVDKGVKGLVPNGRNESGNLNNIEATNTKLTTITVGSNQTNNGIRFRSNSLALGTLFYKEDTNYNYPNTNYTESRSFMEIAKYSSDANGKITSFQAKLPFRAMDASAPHITETYVNGTSGYRIWSDKFCEQWGRAIPAAANNGTIEVTLLKAYKNTNGMCLVTSPDITFMSGGGINYGTSSAKFIANNKIRVKQATGSPEDSNIQWYTTGYLA